MRPSFLAGVATLLLCGSPVLGQEYTPTSESTHILSSSATGDLYQLFVEAPAGLDPGECLDVPTLFITDGNQDYDIVKAVTDGQLPPMVLVGIGYPDEDFMARAVRRSVDLTPTMDEEVAARTLESYGVDVAYGGAREFLAFLRDDAIPFIKANYCASRIRALGGYSFGGLFAAYVLLSEPGLFQRYILGSPSLWYDERVVFTMEDTYAAAHADLRAEVFMSIGSQEAGEYIGDLFSFSQSLESRQYPGLKITTRLWDEEDHITAKVPTYHRGIRVIFADLVSERR